MQGIRNIRKRAIFEQTPTDQLKTDMVSARIVGGTKTAPHKYPWQVSLGYWDGPDDFDHFCGGSIITRRHILTGIN